MTSGAHTLLKGYMMDNSKGKIFIFLDFLEYTMCFPFLFNSWFKMWVRMPTLVTLWKTSLNGRWHGYSWTVLSSGVNICNVGKFLQDNSSQWISFNVGNFWTSNPLPLPLIGIDNQLVMFENKKNEGMKKIIYCPFLQNL